MSKKKKFYKKKGKVVKNLTRNIFKILNEDSNQSYNYKQIAARMGISDTDGKSQILKKLVELTANKKVKETDRGKYQINEERNYFIGTIDITRNGNAYFISDDFDIDFYSISKFR
jgi:ribonuclease R/exosome complex exonuclease DIS3/RRP44